MAGTDPVCEMALAMFCSVLGATAGNLALMVLATGGVFVAGGIAPRILPFLQRGGFREAFDRKGRLHTLVERMPAYVVTHAQPGLLGAAMIAAARDSGACSPTRAHERSAACSICRRYAAIGGQGRPANGRCLEAMASGPHGARAALTGSVPVRLESADTARDRTADERFGRMVGRSPAMQAVFDVLGKASGSDATILLEGETGTGKEVSAEAIHRGSPRRDKPFLVVDCGAMPPNLLESELFGHERGAFTGAVSRARACSRRPTAARSSWTRSAS